jgi:hypothetical protein
MITRAATAPLLALLLEGLAEGGRWGGVVEGRGFRRGLLELSGELHAAAIVGGRASTSLSDMSSPAEAEYWDWLTWPGPEKGRICHSRGRDGCATLGWEHACRGRWQDNGHVHVGVLSVSRLHVTHTVERGIQSNQLDWQVQSHTGSTA